MQDRVAYAGITSERPLNFWSRVVVSGRGQQWSLASCLRTPLENLQSTNSHIAHRCLELSRHLADAQGSTSSADQAAADRAATRYRRLQEQWGAVVAEIRNIKGSSRFLLPPSYEDLQAAAREPHNVPLPSITLTELKNLKDRFARAVRRASAMGPKEQRNDLIVLLRTVWDEIMLPIVNVLERVLELKHLCRIWLCPTTDFTSIPLHAAHSFLTKADGSGKEPCLKDLYICSYTLTLSALIRSRQLMKKRVPPSFVAIGQGQPLAGESKELLTVDSEIELVRKL
ncbi:hypothetical protein BDR04DRAFT_1164417, partial [Suillus decipiens]